MWNLLANRMILPPRDKMRFFRFPDYEVVQAGIVERMLIRFWASPEPESGGILVRRLPVGTCL